MAGPVYIADDESLLRRVELDGLTALFHVPSGMTHIVAPPAPQIIEALAQGPADAEQLVARMRERFELDGDEAAEAMAARLGELEAAGLVRRT